jgi:hypothetical protein
VRNGWLLQTSCSGPSIYITSSTTARPHKLCIRRLTRSWRSRSLSLGPITTFKRSGSQRAISSKPKAGPPGDTLPHPEVLAAPLFLRRGLILRARRVSCRALVAQRAARIAICSPRLTGVWEKSNTRTGTTASRVMDRNRFMPGHLLRQVVMADRVHTRSVLSC